jgi:hypothetical protein
MGLKFQLQPLIEADDTDRAYKKGVQPVHRSGAWRAKKGPWVSEGPLAMTSNLKKIGGIFNYF